MNLNGKRFIAQDNTQGLSNEGTVFAYSQSNKVIVGEYAGGNIVKGNIVGKYLSATTVSFVFQCLTNDGELKSGKSEGELELNSEGRMVINFRWCWLDDVHTWHASSHVEI